MRTRRRYRSTSRIGQRGNGEGATSSLFIVPAGPDPVVPEAPVVALLSVLGLATGGAILMRRNRQQPAVAA